MNYKNLNPMHMRHLLLLLVCLLSCVHGFAQDKTPNALRLTLKTGQDGVREILFTSAPRVTHNSDGIVLTVGKESTEYAYADIGKMTFFYDDGTDAVLGVFGDPETGATPGIFTVDGKHLDRIASPGLYIINGRKVLVK
jgi:hypothetical protein